jgi:choline dehydrogenase-like flavoprotein
MREEVTIVGSGIAGTAATLRLVDRGIHPLVVDVGHEPAGREPIRENLYHLRRRQDLFEVMIGEDFERVAWLARSAARVPAKLTGPRFGFVVQRAESCPPLRQKDYAAIQSFAAGGLANAWGAGLYRFLDRDFEGFPIGPDDLSTYYDRLDQEIGISGEADDLAAFFGRTGFTQSPLRLSQKAERLMAGYRRHRARLNAEGVFLGRPRLGVLSHASAGREGCDYTNLEFWQPELPYIYNPVFTLRRLIREGTVRYQKGLFVHGWSRNEDVIVVHAHDGNSNSEVSFETKRLLLAAGAIGSARLALQSRKDYTTKLCLLDNPTMQFPLVLPRFVGVPLEVDCFGLTQLNLVYQSPAYETPLQGSILEITGPARSEFFSSLPFAARDNLRMIRYLVPAMLVMQFFLPATRQHGASLALLPDGTLHIEGQTQNRDGALVRWLIRTMRKLGALTHPSLVVYPPAGHGIHYAGTLPMVATPSGPYQCDPQGRLFAEPGVYVVDAAVLPRLPAKNDGLTVMANAMRTADHVADHVSESC